MIYASFRGRSTRVSRYGFCQRTSKALAPPKNRDSLTPMRGLRFGLTGLSILLASCAAAPVGQGYDTMIAGGTIYDGSGGSGYVGDVAIKGDRIACVGHCPGTARQTVDA